jgi:hypothetical protein
MRNDFRDETSDAGVFTKGDQVRCIVNYGKAWTVPKLDGVYEVADCYWLNQDIFIDIRIDGGRVSGGWYAKNFELVSYYRMRPKKDPGPKMRFENHRRIILGDTE